MVRGLRNVTYRERMKIMGLHSLSFRRYKSDMTETFKILKGIDKIPVNKIFKTRGRGRTRGHSFKLIKGKGKTNTRHSFFSNRVINHWNKLPSSIMSCPSPNSFRRAIDQMCTSNETVYDLLW